MKNQNPCKKAVSLLDSSIYQALEESESVWLSEHVSGCGNCREEYAAQKELDSFMARFVEAAPRRDLWVDVAARIESSSRKRSWLARLLQPPAGRPTAPTRVPAWAAVPVAAALLAAILLPTPTPDVPRASAVQGRLVSQTAGNTYLYAHQVLNAGNGTVGDQASRLVMSSVLYPGDAD